MQCVAVARPPLGLSRPSAPRRQPRLIAPVASARDAAQCTPWWSPLPAAAAAGCLATLLLVAPGPASAKELIQGVPRVVDGDTLDFSGTRVRLFGIDAPETKQSCTAAKGGDYLCGERAKQALSAKIGKSNVQCEQKNRDKYGRVVGICSLAQSGGQREDLNAWMVQEGQAVAYRQFSKAYVPMEEQAQAAKRGIWSGTFEVPQQWRIDNPRGKAAPSAAAVVASAAAKPPAAAAAAVPAVPAGCAIKGNITAKGEKIYHVPGGSYYQSTVIEPAKGERFFCSAADAEAAGWRAARS
ncbi:hypothetical protein D9Q98_004611 [Chlorella vulgaris]|uniref:TNase-like domain-containing protein n=1 Tax=Chlorella vulgaris TaxID=3077 RepID=A0A9D4TPY0_CHLVU|nr:hypothetical protein D9Q98_004611 [Chlorella vulgaris]